TCVCRICQKAKSPTDGQIAEVIRPSLLDCIKKRHPKWDGAGFVCFDDIGDCRKEYVKEVLQDEIGELSALDEEVVESLRQHEIVSSNIEKQFEKKLTFGERLSDRIAEFGHLHEKIDHLLRRQYNRLFEIQQIQIELLEELGRKREG